MKGKFQRTIYVEDTLWEAMKEAAQMEGRSVSNYLVTLHKLNHSPSPVIEVHAERSVISPRGGDKPSMSDIQIRYKEKHPNDFCPGGCGALNKNCDCDRGSK